MFHREANLSCNFGISAENNPDARRASYVCAPRRCQAGRCRLCRLCAGCADYCNFDFPTESGGEVRAFGRCVSRSLARIPPDRGERQRLASCPKRLQGSGDVRSPAACPHPCNLLANHIDPLFHQTVVFTGVSVIVPRNGIWPAFTAAFSFAGLLILAASVGFEIWENHQAKRALIFETSELPGILPKELRQLKRSFLDRHARSDRHAS